MILTFESVDEIIKCNHSNESQKDVLHCGSTYFYVQIDAEFWLFGLSMKYGNPQNFFKWQYVSFQKQMSVTIEFL